MKQNSGSDKGVSDKLIFSNIGQDMLKSLSDDGMDGYGASNMMKKHQVIFSSAVDLRDKNISRRDAKIIDLMMKRFFFLIYI